MKEEKDSNIPNWDDAVEGDIENLPGGPGGCVQGLELEDPFDIDTILEMKPELYKMSREEAVKELKFSRERLFWAGQDTGKQVILREGKYVTIVSPKYVLVPNEWVASGVEHAVKGLGLTLHEDVSRGGKMFRYYLDEEHEVGPNGELQAGFLVRNSIDGSISFSVSAFAFRQICTNGMTTQVDFGSFNFVHMAALQKLDMTSLSGLITRSVENALNDCRVMKQWEVPWPELPQGQFALDMLRISRLPNTVKPLYLQEANKRLKQDKIPPVPMDLTFWEIYNEFTELISHKEISERTRVEYQTVLHKTLSPLLKVPPIVA